MKLAVLGLFLAACGGSPCDELARSFRACGDGGETEDEEVSDCNEQEEECSQCYLDSPKDVCTELDAIATDCSDACSQL